jgi:hypothetical protein
MVTHACNPSYSSGRDQKEHCLKPAMAKKKTPSQKISQAWWHIPIIPAIREAFCPEQKCEALFKK